ALHNVTINNLLPGAIDTDRLRSTIETIAKSRKLPIEQVRAERIATIPAGRFGTVEDFGAACAWLCSAQASYITGQNWLVDGGAYPGTF
ncbi:MAG: SDR family oxidoreductase, partial [Stellaceae bacterium]